MDERLTPEELRELLGAFALGAVDPEERTQVEEFVLDDRDARVELHQLEHAVAWLGHASPRPTDAAWETVRLDMARDLENGDTAGVPGNSDVVSMTEFAARRGRRSWRQIVAIAAAGLVLLGTAIGVARVIVKDSANTTSRSALRSVSLRSPDGGVPVRVVLDRDGRGSVRSSDLPPALSGHVYQLWAQSSPTAAMHSAGLLGRSPKGHRVHVPAGSVRIAISVEPEGGSGEPTTDPVAVSGTL